MRMHMEGNYPSKMDHPVKQNHSSSSVLIDLKAEIIKKRGEIQKNEIIAKEPVPPKVKKFTIVAKKEVRDAEAARNNTSFDSEQEEEDLKRSRAALQAKSRYYEQLTTSGSIPDADSKAHFLVDFEKNASNQILEERRKIYEALEKQTEKEVVSRDDAKYSNFSREGDEPTEGAPSTAGPEHYQRLRGDEIREMGVGYYEFSSDETVRAQQMEKLKQLREQTQSARVKREAIKEKRAALMAARLAKVRQRKGLPPEPPAETAPEVLLPPAEPEPATPVEPATGSGLLPKVREWDVGKPGVVAPPEHLSQKGKFREISQEEYVDKQREARLNEFAPPSIYFDSEPKNPWNAPKQIPASIPNRSHSIPMQPTEGCNTPIEQDNLMAVGALDALLSRCRQQAASSTDSTTAPSTETSSSTNTGLKNDAADEHNDSVDDVSNIPLPNSPPPGGSAPNAILQQ